MLAYDFTSNQAGLTPRCYYVEEFFLPAFNQAASSLCSFSWLCVPGLFLVLMNTRGGNYSAWPAINSVLLVLGPAVSAGLPS